VVTSIREIELINHDDAHRERHKFLALYSRKSDIGIGPGLLPALPTVQKLTNNAIDQIFKTCQVGAS
jgi:hypothetical protein